MVFSLTSVTLVFHTPLFGYLAWPVRWTLEAMPLPEAGKAAPGFLVGFLYQYTPAVIPTGVDSEKTRSVLAGF